jgi:hypothetical protein
MACFLERLGGNPSFFPDLAEGETAATEVKRRWNAEGARNAPIAKSLKKPGLEISECKEACHPVNGYPFSTSREAITCGMAMQMPCGYGVRNGDNHPRFLDIYRRIIYGDTIFVISGTAKTTRPLPGLYCWVERVRRQFM